MSEIDKQEMTRWLQGISSLCQEYDAITGRITEGWGKGFAEYKGVLAEGELPALLEKLRKMPVPEDSEYQRVTQNFGNGIDARIRAETATAEYAGGNFDRNLSASRALWLSASRSCLSNMIRDLASLSEKYRA